MESKQMHIVHFSLKLLLDKLNNNDYETINYFNHFNFTKEEIIISLEKMIGYNKGVKQWVLVDLI